MVMLRIFRYLTIFFGFCLILLCYFIHTVNILYRQNEKDNWAEKVTFKYPRKVPGNDYYNVKNIVAYSLLKRIENESEEFSCGDDFRFPKNFEERGGLWTKVGGTGLYVLSVHFDTRLSPYNFIRIIGMTKGIPANKIYCQIRSRNNTNHFTKAVITTIWSEEWNKNDVHSYFEPVLLSCRVPNVFKPKFVSLSTEPCGTPHSNFAIEAYNDTSRRLNFTICVKPLVFNEDISEGLLQWIQINEILGAQKINIYYHLVNDRTKGILEWLQTNGKKIEVFYFEPIEGSIYPDGSEMDAEMVWQRRKYEVAAYNDCFYKNLNSDYVIPLDIDEIIVPKQENNWKDLFDTISGALKDRFASFSVRNAYYFREPNNKTENEPVFFFRYASRSKLSGKEESGKSFISSRNSLTVFNHYTLDTLRPGVGRTYFMTSNKVQLNHYKKNCSIVILPECEKYISSQRFLDYVIFKYKEEFRNNYCNIINRLKSVNIL
ncbi:uncharacterized protein LOC123317399 [Coccinella septempunctata]|uniref:uncharacterized protein LOC123317399 n=1 Tax=Coccinella septempunctata TaxID=41139 RepID=UPI001D06DBC6|nr:uncharacterized protein LOC123317399 [Coccinella septempunctata]